MGAASLTFLGVGAIIGTGIFVLSAEAAQKAGPAMLLSFVLAGAVCAVAALCYAELSAMVPVSGSAYTYTYAVLGELLAWMVGWALILEYLVSCSAVAVGWSGYVVGLIEHAFQTKLPTALTASLAAGGLINLPAALVAMTIAGLLSLGTRQSTRITAVLVTIKISALVLFTVLALPAAKPANFAPFAPTGVPGIAAAAASIFFAFAGFDAVSTASEETRDPQRNMPIGILASLGIVTVFYLLVATGAIGSGGAQPLFGPNGQPFPAGSAALAQKCLSFDTAHGRPLVCTPEALAQVLRGLDHPIAANLIGLAAGIALPSVILTMMFGQTRIFFTMARDGLLPSRLATVHAVRGTPHVAIIVTGAVVATLSAFFPIGQLAEIANSGTLFAFLLVSVAVMILRVREPGRHRPFRTPLIWLVGPLAVIGCLVLYFSLSLPAKLLFPIWSSIGLLIYLAYGYRHSNMRDEA